MEAKRSIPEDGTRFGAYSVILTPKYIILIEKPGRGRGYELAGGHGKPEETSLQECGAREALEETGADAEPEELEAIGEPRELGTHTLGYFLIWVDTGQTFKKEGDEGEIVHIIKHKDVKRGGSMRTKIFPPHLATIDLAFAMRSL